MSVAECSWSDVAPGWDRWRDQIEAGDGAISDVLLDGVGPLAGRDVLELAAGNGELASRIAREVGPGGSVLATDASEGMVELLQARLGALDHVEVRRVDACTTGLAHASYDAVICRFGLMLVPDPAAATAEVRRVLRPGGRFGVAVWGEAATNPWLASVGMAAMMQGLVGGSPPAGPGSPFFLGEPGALGALLERAGFGDVTVQQVDGTRQYADVAELVAMGTSLAPPLHRAVSAASPLDSRDRWRVWRSHARSAHAPCRANAPSRGAGLDQESAP